ncbi:hypothetical protein [Aureimonas sp. AU22]|uniref:hypothetical protein n=1 Tax=Aureimonas sp. AU22 TaxID=1638162 RepID=UPI000780E694|nr:hypothetical protein [Aureimonas sp. AU22]
MTGIEKSGDRSVGAFFVHVNRSFRKTFDTRVSEWALAAILFLWSVVLHLNPKLFQEGPSYVKMADLMPQHSWAILCLMAGGGRLIILLVNGLLRRSPHLRCLGSFVSCFFWFQILIGLMQSGTYATGLAVYPVLLALECYHTIRCARLARAVDTDPPAE